MKRTFQPSDSLYACIYHIFQIASSLVKKTKRFFLFKFWNLSLKKFFVVEQLRSTAVLSFLAHSVA